MSASFYLSDRHRNSETWREIEAYASKRLAELREQNDHPTPEAQTACLRGRIAELKALLSIGRDERPIVHEPRIF